MFRETENFYVSATERLRRRGKSETKSSVNKNMNTYLICMKRCEFSWLEDNKEMTAIKWSDLYCTFGVPLELTQNFRVSLDEKTKNNLKLLKDEML